MGQASKRAQSNHSVVDSAKRYEVAEALELIKGQQQTKFNESVDVAIKLGVDAKKSDQMVRGVVMLPHGTGKNVKVLVFAKGEKENEAKEAGADFVGSDELVEKIKGGWLEFDKAIATPDMMGSVGQIARILGPRGLMPNPKVGTVTTDVAKAVAEQKAGRVEFRVEKAGIIHAPIGRMSFSAEQLKENFIALLEQILKLKPATAKGIYLQRIAVSSTMGAGLRLDASRAQAQVARG
jgi:large subunit ribosomal protein L1